jgi:hypothetical protein
VRAMRCQRRTGEGRASSLTCAYASAASSMPLTEAAWRREHAAHHIAASETQQSACEQGVHPWVGVPPPSVGPALLRCASAHATVRKSCAPKTKQRKQTAVTRAESFRRLQQTHFLGRKG